MTSALGSPVELSGDPAFARRVRRLVGVSAVALGVVWLLAHAAPGVGAAAEAALVAGWIAMPALLALSLARPRLRLLLALPAGLVGGALLDICLTALPAGGAARVGWPLITAGVLAGGGMGGWLWYRWMPVPRALAAPFSPARWALIGVHAAAVLAGMLLVALDLV